MSFYFLRSGFLAALLLCAAALSATETIELSGGVRASDTVPVAGPQGLTPENALHAARFGGKDTEAAIEFGNAHGLTGLEGAVREQLEH